MEMTMNSSRLVAAVAGLALAATMAACSSSPPATSEAGTTGAPPSGPAPTEVAIGIRSDISGFDPHTLVGDFGDQQMAQLVYSKLVARTLDGEIIPQVATSWDVTASRAVFQIRKDETCSDGSPLTPAVIARSFQRLADPKTGSGYVERLFPGGGAKIEGDDEAGTVTFTLKEPNSDLLAAAANVGSIVCGPGLENPKSMVDTPSGAGPYKLTKSKRGDAYVFERRDDMTSYPDGTTPEDLPEKVTLRVISDDSAMVNAILTGELDAGSVLGRDGERLEQGGEFNAIKAPAFSVDGLTFNHSDGLPGADQAFRAAVSLAIDPQAYTTAATFDRGEVGRTLYTPNMDCYDEANASLVPETDVDGAAAALDEAGYKVVDGHRTKPDGSPLSLRLVGLTTQNNGPQYIADVLDQLDIKVDTSVTPGDQALATVFDGDFDVFVYPFTSSLGTPLQIVGAVRGDIDASNNVARIVNERYNTAADKAIGDVKTRCESWGEAERVLLEDSEAKPLTQPVAYYYAKGITFKASYYLVDPFTIRSSS
jgi:peptide/nickel transport system substrate-binding protein